ncbi:hypothetical protein D3C87_1660500 [compost metagenome]
MEHEKMVCCDCENEQEGGNECVKCGSIKLENVDAYQSDDDDSDGLVFDFEAGNIRRNGAEVMTLDELIFLLDGAKQYSGMFPIPQATEFFQELHERLGLMYTKEQFDEIKKFFEGDSNGE